MAAESGKVVWFVSVWFLLDFPCEAEPEAASISHAAQDDSRIEIPFRFISLFIPRQSCKSIAQLLFPLVPMFSYRNPFSLPHV